MLMMINLLLSIMFLFMNHPMTMGLTLLLQTIMISLITGILSMNFWFSYILFLIMVGGMLVLFIYMTSIASNELFIYSNKMLLMTLFLLLSMISIYMLIDNFYINIYMEYNQSHSYMYINNLNKYLNYPSITLIIFIITYLFITLIAVVKISKIEYGPLRQKF